MSDAEDKPKRKTKPTRGTAADFWAILPEGKFMHVPTRQMWDGAVINQLCGEKSAASLVLERGCSQLTWAPGLPMVIRDKVCLNGEWRESPGQNVFNWYMPPTPPVNGDASKAGKWLDLTAKLWGDDSEHLICWLASRVQHPDIKINHGLLLGSNGHGIGKDSWLYPVARAVGRNNWRNVSAGRAFKQADEFNAFLENVIVRISEAHDLKEQRFAFYDKMKDWCAAPPETIEVADKHVKGHPIANVVGPIITSNHLTDGVYIPPEDRRLFVAWSERRKEDFPENFWNEMYDWYDKRGGTEHVMAYLLQPSLLAAFDPKAPPPKTEAWHAIVATGAEPADAELNDVLDAMGDASYLGEPEPMRPQAITVSGVANVAMHIPRLNGLYSFLSNPKNARIISHRFERCGYTAVNNRDNDRGFWRVAGARQMVYAMTGLSGAQRHAAAAEYVRTESRAADRRKRTARPTNGSTAP